MECLEPSCRISPKDFDHAENTLFQSGLPIFPNITANKVSSWLVQKTYSFIHCGGIIWDRGGNFSKFIDLGRHQGTSYQGTWTVCIEEAKSGRKSNVLSNLHSRPHVVNNSSEKENTFPRSSFVPDDVAYVNATKSVTFSLTKSLTGLRQNRIVISGGQYHSQNTDEGFQ